MNRTSWRLVTGLSAIILGAVCTSAYAQAPEIKEKPRMYTYVADWTIPRARWPEMAKPNPGDQKILDKALASGGLVGYGDDATLLHSEDGSTHDAWWSSMSMAGTLNVLDEFEKSGGTTASILVSATKHSDSMWVSQYYNWHSGSWKGAYTYTAVYQLKPDAPDDAVDVLAKSLVAPMLEKLLADGTIVEYEVDEQAIHTQAPGLFAIDFISPTAEGIDKFAAALRETVMKSPLAAPAFVSMVDWTKHRDLLSRTNATYK
jgi:hypothetical protein